MYNSEITCAYMPASWTYEKFTEKIWEIGAEMNKVILGFLRQILGVGKKTTNIAIHGETGKYPISIKIFTHIIKYWLRLKGEDVSDLLKETYELNNRDQMAGKQNWLKIVEYLKKYTNMAMIGPDCCKTAKLFKHKIQTKYNTWWSTEIKNTSKLDFYGRHKKYFRFEPYLDDVSRGSRVYITRLRVSSHCLPVEIQRYRKNRPKREDRKCPICSTDGIADEDHYLLKCTNSEIFSIRENFFTKIRNEVPQLASFTNTNIINYCLNMSDPNIQSVTAEYVRNILCMYREETDGTTQPIVQTIITRVGRIIRKPQRLGLESDNE